MVYFCAHHYVIIFSDAIKATDLRQGFDIAKEPVFHDVNLVLGFISSLALVLRIKFRGLAWLAIPCHAFTRMSISQHRRSVANPYGCCEFPFVINGNTICTRSCLLVLVCIARSVYWFTENPLQSSLNLWPFFNHLMAMKWLNGNRTSWWKPYLL